MKNKKSKDLHERVLKRTLTTLSGIGTVIKNFASWFEEVYIHMSIQMLWKNLEIQIYHQECILKQAKHEKQKQQ